MSKFSSFTTQFQQVQLDLDMKPDGIPGDDTTAAFKLLCERALAERDAARAKPNPSPAGPAGQYTESFVMAMQFILPHENEYARGHWGDPKFVVAENVSGDSGGVTKYGIDKSSHPGVDIANLTEEGAWAIYWKEFQAHRLDLLPNKIAVAVFDVYVNGGHPIEWLQTAINAAGRTPPLVVDGGLGPSTLNAVQQLTNIEAVLSSFIKLRDQRFEAIANGGRAKFLSGWLQRDADLRKFLSVA